jgi:hypothetical protein
VARVEHDTVSGLKAARDESAGRLLRRFHEIRHRNARLASCRREHERWVTGSLLDVLEEGRIHLTK